VTIDRHIQDQQMLNPDATGAFSRILSDLSLAAKLISREVNMAGLVDILGGVGSRNVHAEAVQKLDLFAQEVIYKAMDHSGTLCCMVSEESAEIIPIPERFPRGEYVLMFDPLDGSSNIDVNISIGTIFSLYRKVSDGDHGVMEDCLRAGFEQVGAGYVLYGSSTMLVYTAGRGVHGFTLDPSIGEFLLSHKDIKLPQPAQRTYSINEAYAPRWTDAQRGLVDRLKSGEEGGWSSRYIGSFVADFHRTLLKGGLFMYPGDKSAPEGKLRLLYEAAPMAFLCEQAGGRASSGSQEILQIRATDLHQRTPLILGSKAYVDLAERLLSEG